MPLKERISAFDGLDITPEQREILEAIREFVDREVIPVAKELEARDEFPTKIVEGLRDMGAFGMRIPTEYGGLGLDLVTYALVIAELTRGWMAVSGIVNGQYIVSGMIGAHGTDEQKQNYLPRLAVGEIRSCFSMTEPDAGSDVQAIRTIARREGDEFVIDGNKMWVTNGDRASLIALLVKTDPDADPRHTGMTALLVEKEALVAQQNGLTVSPPLGQARLSRRRISRVRLRRIPRTGLGRTGWRGDDRQGLLPDDVGHRNGAHQRRLARPRHLAARA
jgi:alkylation response protein AidB-like acyl-CoA dehydrogenase